MSATFRLLRMPDRVVINTLRGIAEALRATNATYRVWITKDGPTIGEMKPADLDKNEDLKRVLDLETAVLNRAVLSLPQGGNAGNVQVSLTREENGFDQVQIGIAQNLDSGAASRILAAAAEQFKPYDTAGKIEVIVGEQLAEFYKIREETLGRLERLNERLVEDAAVYRRRVDEEAAALKAKLEGEAKAEQEQRAAEFQTRIEALQRREEELAAEKKALDDRSSRHARRQHHKDLKKALQARSEKFSLTEETIQKRWPVHVLYVVLTVATMVILSVVVWDQLHATEFSWYRVIRLPVALAGFIAAVVFYIRWNDEWFRQHADEEFRLKRLDLDIDRASWVVEMALEWRDENGTAIPQELIERLTRNLFQDGEPRKPVRHPSEDLASLLLGASAGLRVRIPGIGEAVINRRGVRDLKKKARSLAGGDEAEEE